MNIDQHVNSIVQSVVEELNSKVQAQVMDTIAQKISDIINQMDLQILFQSALTSAVANKQFQFPAASIPATAINTDNLSISGNQIFGGIVTNFGSTGIDDKATGCQLTILDDMTVVENNLLTKDLTVKGTVNIEGDLNVTGTLLESSPLFQKFITSAVNNVRSSLDQVIFQSYADMVFARIKTNGIDLTKITSHGQPVLDGANLSTFVTSSNLQKVGVLQELQVQGETLLGETLYVSGKRVGVNTIAPAQALSVWDQEVEVGISKQSTNTAIIGTPRNQTLVVSSNGQNNLVLTPDGAVTVNQLNMGNISIRMLDTPPSDNQPKGSIVFNTNPSLGGPMGWVSLGDAKWGNFGIID